MFSLDVKNRLLSQIAGAMSPYNTSKFRKLYFPFSVSFLQQSELESVSSFNILLASSGNLVVSDDAGSS